MNITYLEKLEYNKILENLINYCTTYIGKEEVAKMLPSNKKEAVLNMLCETNEASAILYKASTPPLAEIADITTYLKILNSEGTLSLKAILDLTKILKISNDLKKYLSQDFINLNDFPIMANQLSRLYTNEGIMEKINKIVLDENTISDDASTTLKDIRRKKRKIEQNIKNTLNTILHTHSKYIQENIVTIRNDRYVIPVKDEARNQIKGLIHDISSTGSTVFIEPLAVFELNNDLNNLKIAEKIEIENIIKELSNLFIPYTDNLETTLKTIGFLDFIFAKAKYSKELHAICPVINEKKIINLKNVKHPLLNQKTAVPINIEIGESYGSLIITGPNTGGKTVTLKTVGLIVLMACSGLHIPADTGSSIFIFDNVFADIGDDQSIADSLSTFSSHMLNIVDITKNASSNSLILVDELGSGTDPIEGANLAISILEYFKNIGSITIATTHYQELKKYALVNDYFENASVEFNIETLSPTYKLLIGVPGKSNAFEISKKLGLDKSIINNAKLLLKSDDIKFETILKNIYDDKTKIEQEKVQISAELEKVSSLRASLEKEKNDKEQKAIQLINSAKLEARKILQNAKSKANEAIKQLEHSSSSKDINNLRNSLNDQIKDISIVNSVSKPTQSKYTIPKEEIVPNLKVWVSSLKQEGTVVSRVSKSDEVMVQIGSMKMNINIKFLEKSKSSKKDVKSNYSYNISKSRTASSEINVIGEDVLTATAIVDKFLDDCALAKLQTVRIVHGKGTGKLKNGIHEFLKHNPHVKSFRMGTFGEGEMGVTVVELK